MEQISISKDKNKLNIDFIFNFLDTSYWAKGRTKKQVEKSIIHSECYGIYKGDQQIGFARMITDQVVYTYLLDVFIHPDYQGNGYGKLLMEYISNDPILSDIKLWTLRTKDAHTLYEQFGFKALADASKCMEKVTKASG